MTWKITPIEKRKRVRKFILKTWLILIILVIFSLFYYRSDFFSWMLHEGFKSTFNKILYTTIGVVVCICLFFLLNKFFPYRLRTYYLDDMGVVISKSRKKKHFFWNQFECFYPYRSYQSDSSYPKKSTKKQLLETEQQFEGQIFYLKKKSAGFLSVFYKIFIVIHSRPDNSKNVSKFLNRHLPQKKMTSNTDLGLIFYGFK